MLDITFGYNDPMVEVPSEQVEITCDECDQEAFIFQEEGNFCLECWQERTCPLI
jgi:hypothetical protein